MQKKKIYFFSNHGLLMQWLHTARPPRSVGPQQSEKGPRGLQMWAVALRRSEMRGDMDAFQTERTVQLMHASWVSLSKYLSSITVSVCKGKKVPDANTCVCVYWAWRRLLNSCFIPKSLLQVQTRANKKSPSTCSTHALKHP